MTSKMAVDEHCPDANDPTICEYDGMRWPCRDYVRLHREELDAEYAHRNAHYPGQGGSIPFCRFCWAERDERLKESADAMLKVITEDLPRIQAQRDMAQQENERLRAALTEIMECQDHFYTEGDDRKPKRLPAPLVPYAGPLSVIFRTAFETLGRHKAR